jgi:anionic cell wall polymer biosynthesis LytR-Cps2A-Psr (LCP) family protein
MKKKFIIIILTIFIGISFSFFPFKFLTFAYKEVYLLSPIPGNNQGILNSNNKAPTSNDDPNKTFTGKTNILLIGMDARINDKNPRCDAIHLLNLDWDYKLISIINIPRGTPVNLSSSENQNSIISNSCHTNGLNFAKKEIERITGEKIDYTVKVGFSQTQGILRTLGFDPISTLQFLRSRKYAIGDNQRTHNQGKFIQQLLISKYDLVAKIPKPLKYLLYKTVDTDLDYEKAVAIFEQIKDFEIGKNPEKIMLITKSPSSDYLKDIKFIDANTPKDEEYYTYQNKIISYLHNLTAKAENLYHSDNKVQAVKILTTPYSQKLWLQVDEENTRNELHFQMLKWYSLSLNGKEDISSLILDYITEMENINNIKYVKSANELLAEMKI